MSIHDFAAATMAAVNAHDPEAIVALWAEPADYDSPLTGAQTGLAALRMREQALFAGFSDLRAVITVLEDHGDNGTMVVHFDGTHDGTYAGIPASGRPIAVDLIAALTFDSNGKAVAESIRVDVDALVAQLTN
jgi:steroid delta-isomerase-like uncharacterized protein